MAQQAAQLFVRYEVFEHCIFPTPPKLSLMNLINLFSSLNVICTPDNKITIDQFKENACKHIPNINAKDAEIYFLTYKIMVEEDQQFLINAAKKQANWAQQQTQQTPQQQQNQQQQNVPIVADVKGLAIYLFLQLFGISSRQNLGMDNKMKDLNSQFNEGFRGNANQLQHNFSPLNSPRSKTTRMPQFTSEMMQMIYYIKQNIKIILKLVSNDINNEDSLLQQNEFNLVGLIIRSQQAKQKALISAQSKLYQGVTRVNINTLSDWVQKNLSMNDAQEFNDTLTIQGLTKSVMNKDDKTCKGKDIRLIACEDSYIYIDSSVLTLSIINCVNTTIFVAAVNKTCTIEKCENVIVTVASNFLRVGNTIDSKIYYYGSYFPVLYGDNRSITLAPNNANYNEFYERLKNAKIPIIYKCSQLYGMPFILNQNQNINYNIENQKDFFPLILPSQFKPVHHSLITTFEQVMHPNFEKQLNDSKNQEITNIIVPIIAPNEYREAIINKFKLHGEIQQLIKGSNLTEEQQTTLHAALQGYFREWLVSTGAIKPISDLVKLIDQD